MPKYTSNQFPSKKFSAVFCSVMFSFGFSSQPLSTSFSSPVYHTNHKLIAINQQLPAIYLKESAHFQLTKQQTPYLYIINTSSTKKISKPIPKLRIEKYGKWIEKKIFKKLLLIIIKRIIELQVTLSQVTLPHHVHPPPPTNLKSICWSIATNDLPRRRVAAKNNKSDTICLAFTKQNLDMLAPWRKRRNVQHATSRDAAQQGHNILCSSIFRFISPFFPLFMYCCCFIIVVVFVFIYIRL